tara:strand:- start:819 stop:1187 length:369 start_codon:yes stop_codon:yes gene_type:complete
MGALTVRSIVETGLTVPSYETAASGGDTMTNTGKEFLLVKNSNGSAASREVTITAQTTSVDHTTLGVLTKSNVVKSIAAGASALIGPFPTVAFNNTSGNIEITYSDSAADITILAFSFESAS